MRDIFADQIRAQPTIAAALPIFLAAADALIAAATTQSQTVIETTLAQAPAHAGEVTPPALFVVGEVVRLRAGLDWLGALTGRVLEADPLDLNTNLDAG